MLCQYIKVLFNKYRKKWSMQGVPWMRRKSVLFLIQGAAELGLWKKTAWIQSVILTLILFCFVFKVFSSVQFSSVTQSCLTLCHPMDCSTPGFPVYYQFPELTQTHVGWVRDAVQPSHPLSSPSPAFSHSKHQGLFKWVSSSHQVAKGLVFQL